MPSPSTRLLENTYTRPRLSKRPRPIPTIEPRRLVPTPNIRVSRGFAQRCSGRRRSRGIREGVRIDRCHKENEGGEEERVGRSGHRFTIAMGSDG